MDRLPRWADVALVPLVSLTLAAIISALVIIAIGQDPWEAITVMVEGSVMNAYGWGYTLYYATSFIFTGLAVTVAFHAGLFNIGGEGQAQLGGIGAGTAALALGHLPGLVALLVAVLAAALVGALLVWITPLRVWETAVMGLAAGGCGTLGDFVMRALKKDAGVHYWGNQSSVTGAVGLLDRVAPLCFAAPVFFHSARWYASLQP